MGQREKQYRPSSEQYKLVDDTDFDKQEHVVKTGACQSGLTSHGEHLYKTTLLLVREKYSAQHLGTAIKHKYNWTQTDYADVIMCGSCALKAFSKIRKKFTLLVSLIVGIFIGSFALLALCGATGVKGLEVLGPILIGIAVGGPFLLVIKFQRDLSEGLYLTGPTKSDSLAAKSIELASKYYFNLKLDRNISIICGSKES